MIFYDGIKLKDSNISEQKSFHSIFHEKGIEVNWNQGKLESGKINCKTFSIVFGEYIKKLNIKKISLYTFVSL